MLVKLMRPKEIVDRLIPEAQQPQFSEVISGYINAAPNWLDFDSNNWNIAPLHRLASVKKYTINFDAINHLGIRGIAKIYCIYLLVEKGVGPQSIRAAWEMLVVLGEMPAARSVESLNSEDFYWVENKTFETFSTGTAHRRCATLAVFGRWLTKNTSLRISYFQKHKANPIFGRGGTEAGRRQKLLPDEVVQQLLAARHASEMSERDQFFLAAIAVSVCTGFRVEELLTLPRDCLVDDGDALIIRCFAAKGGKIVPRIVPPELEKIARDAIAYLLAVTEPARQRAQELYKAKEISWEAVISGGDEEDIKYFVRRWLADWISHPFNRLIDTEEVFFTPRGGPSQWLPLGEIFRRHNGNVSAISREMGIGRRSVALLCEQLISSRQGRVYLGGKNLQSQRSFDTDVRFPSVSGLASCIGYKSITGHAYSVISELVKEARMMMVHQKPFTPPTENPEIESKYVYDTAILQCRHTGKVFLHMHEALMVVFKDQLSHHIAANMEVVTRVTKSSFAHWLSGYKRDRGTGKPTDSLCARLGIVDPRTGSVAEFTHHDFRHWLNTAFENGGLTQTQIATLFNRKSVSGNSIYSQTSVETRRDRLETAMSKGKLVGHVAETFSRLSKDTPEEASEYLASAVQFYNPMPHGICRMNWAVEPCPHTLSCFSCGGDESLCEHLIVDLSEDSQVCEIRRVNENAKSIIKIMEEEGAVQSPQFKKFHRIAASTGMLLSRKEES
jgi:integrase